MGNMSYCRFRNTLTDLKDCEENLDDIAGLDDEERKAALKLIKACQRIAERFGEGQEVEA